MRRRTPVLLLAALTLAVLLAGGRALAAAQGTDSSAHPAVGTWLVDADPADPVNPLELSVLSADGGVVDLGADGASGAGRWEPTGDASANVTFTIFFPDGARVVVRADVEIAADGQSFAGTYTNEFFFDPTSGEGSGEIGPGRVEGTRVAAEGPGTPVASFEEFFAQFGGTPEATPAP